MRNTSQIFYSVGLDHARPSTGCCYLLSQLVAETTLHIHVCKKIKLYIITKLHNELMTMNY